jgi:DNA-binding CsgD family transcriptional regulator
MALAREVRQPLRGLVAQLAKAAIAAERGDEILAETLTADAEARLTQMGALPVLSLVRFVRGRGAVAHQRYEEGYQYLRTAWDPGHPLFNPAVGAWGLSDLVEAAVNTGRRSIAVQYLDDLTVLAGTTGGPLLRATLAYARPLLASDADVESLFIDAIDRDLADWPCYRGRMLLWYGRWLRRRRRIADSRVPLRAALEGFSALAFPALAAVAIEELRASGAAVATEKTGPWAGLTPQELGIARLASTGETNRDIGRRLYLSPRTVQSHLYRIFPKLGITARAQLRDALAEPAYS